jgi:hypothetical protein
LLPPRIHDWPPAFDHQKPRHMNQPWNLENAPGFAQQHFGAGRPDRAPLIVIAGRAKGDPEKERHRSGDP